LIRNVQAARAWFKLDGPARGLPLELTGSHQFQLLERTQQPSLPGPLPDDFARWDTPLPRPERLDPTNPGGPEGTVVDRQRQPIEFRSKRLPVLG
jgi:hypothetical protein